MLCCDVAGFTSLLPKKLEKKPLKPLELDDVAELLFCNELEDELNVAELLFGNSECSVCKLLYSSFSNELFDD